jgi:transposase InsO family protein
MARDNVLWGAERIRGELLKLGIRVSKRTIQKYSYAARSPRPRGQIWTTFLRTHTHPIWACDFVQTYDVFFRAVFAFFIIDLGSRKVVHVGVTRSPTASWVAQQQRNVTSFDVAAPRFLIRDNDSKFGTEFDPVADGAGITILRTPYHAPKANAVCERFLGSVRRECLDHTLILGVGHLERVLAEYVTYFNGARPHQGVRQLVPSPTTKAEVPGTTILAVPVLSGLHHDYSWAA